MRPPHGVPLGGSRAAHTSSSATFFVIVATPLPSIAPDVPALVDEPPACSPGEYAPLPVPAPKPGSARTPQAGCAGGETRRACGHEPPSHPLRHRAASTPGSPPGGELEVGADGRGTQHVL
eukprot:121979-Prymnesium_polylepis.2